MANGIKTLLLITLFIFISGCGEAKKEYKTITRADLVTEEDKASYVVGIDMAKWLESSGNQLKLDSFIQGFSDQFNKRPSLLTDGEMELVRNETKKKTSKADPQRVMKKVETKDSSSESEKFLVENEKNEGVKITKSGLQYIVLREGKGSKPEATDQVKVHYIGSLISGEEFENTYKRNDPATIPLNQVVKGFKEGLMLMPEGSKYKFFISPELGYGKTGKGVIGPNSVLVFEVELLEIIKNITK